MNEIQKGFDKQFEKGGIKIFIKENKWAIVSLFLCLTIMFLALGFKDAKDSYAVYYLKQYLENNNCICHALGNFTIRGQP